MAINSTIPLFETQFFPALPFFALAAKHGTVVLEAHENYQKGSFRNKCIIRSANGPQVLSIPLKKGKHEQALITRVTISDHEDWRTNHWRSIIAAYGSAPFFEEYGPVIKSALFTDLDLLYAFNRQLIDTLCRCLNRDSGFQLRDTTTYRKSAESSFIDCRNAFPYRNRANWTERIASVPYPQVFLEKGPFVPGLSILDLLFCTGPESIIYLDQIGQLLCSST